MKPIYSKLGAKITAIILFVITTALFIASVSGIAYMAYNKIYYDDGSSARKKLYKEYCEIQNEDIADIVQNSMRTKTVEYITAQESAADEDINMIKNGNSLDLESLKEAFSDKKTNLGFTIYDSNNNFIFKNYTIDSPVYSNTDNIEIVENRYTYKETSSFETYQERWQHIEDYQNKYIDVNYEYYDEDTDADGVPECVLLIEYSTGNPVLYKIEENIPQTLSVKDDLYYNLKWFETAVDMKYSILVVTAMLLAVLVILFTFLMCSAGHKMGVDGIHLNWVDKIPYDLYFSAGVALIMLFVSSAAELHGSIEMKLISLLIAGCSIVLLIIANLMSFAARAKEGEWWKNTVIYRILLIIKKVILWFFRQLILCIRSIPIVLRTVIILIILGFYNLIVILVDSGSGLVLGLIEFLILVPAGIIVAAQFKKAEKAVESIKGGNYDTKLNEEKMIPALRNLCVNINNINEGMAREVADRLKSERFKTELITNVSHDIKTPLTSIINYVDLIKKEDINNEKVKDYVSVLDRQSVRLKKLIEDLVECSKASTGNIAVNLSQIDVCVLLDQLSGEYIEKLDKRSLSLVINKPEKPVYIMADGRLLWRVLDNVLNNACKYSLESSRVYVNLDVYDGNAVICFKNISKEQLNISTEELLERFVRGDSSRNTEGSGLGLSIAKSLMDLQKGTFKLEVDGDMFKAIVSFRIISNKEE